MVKKRRIFNSLDTELKQCPFCNGQAEFYIVNYDGDKTTKKWWFSIRCKSYKCAIAQQKSYLLEIKFCKNGDIAIITDERIEALENWNKRINKSEVTGNE